MEQTVNRDCSKCGEPISEKRLAARPDAMLCLSCKQEADEPKVTAFSRFLAKSLAESSLSDDGEMMRSAHEMVGSE